MDTNVLIALPTNRGLKGRTLQSLLELRGASAFMVSTKGYNTAENRNYLAAQAVKGGYSHVFFADDDMVYEPDTLERLLAHDKDVVGGNYSVRAEVEGNDLVEHIEGKDESKLYRCRSLGGGCMLVKTDVFKKISQPWFGYEWHENGMVKVSNDWFFCRKLDEVWCDPDVTPIHLGNYGY